jgi:hypothetical protein
LNRRKVSSSSSLGDKKILQRFFHERFKKKAIISLFVRQTSKQASNEATSYVFFENLEITAMKSLFTVAKQSLISFYKVSSSSKSMLYYKK